MFLSKHTPNLVLLCFVSLYCCSVLDDFVDTLLAQKRALEDIDVGSNLEIIVCILILHSSSPHNREKH